jgi:tetratricopeptide (TPR) repeat protein
MVFNPADLAEEVDLDLERRKEILHAEARLAKATHYELLGLPWNAGADAAKAAYVDRVKVFHPDRYAGKRLGTYRPRLERVFRRLTEARDTLVDDAKRAAYAKATAPATEVAKAAARQIEDERRSEERRARLARQNPMLARAGRVAELLARGREALQAGRFQEAANDFGLVATLDPGNRDAGELAAEARKRAQGGRVQEVIDKATSAEVMGNYGHALAAWRAAVEIDPGSVRATLGGVRAALQIGDATSARELAAAAIKAAPRHGPAHEALGQALEAAGNKGEARKAYERALELDPKLDTAKERLKKLRWSFLG